MKMFRISLAAFVVAFVLSVSAVASAVTTTWWRAFTGDGTGGFGGVGAGCSVTPSGSWSGTDVWLCPLTGDTNYVSTYDSVYAYFTNANLTQPAFGCVSFHGSSGNSCAGTANNNCFSTGPCVVNPPVSKWNSNSTEFKYLVFDRMSSGAQLSGYVVYYNHT
jgi:hypothetical protein